MLGALHTEDWPAGYTLVEQVGVEGYSQVFMVVKTSDNATRALKRYTFKDLSWNRSLPEYVSYKIDIMTEVDNEHVLKIYEVIKSPKYTNLILDLCDGGDLSKIMRTNNQVFTEQALKPFFFDLLKGFQALRAKNIMHRDIKPENLLIKNDKISIGDFGMCKYGFVKTGTVVGNLCTIAPEIRQIEFGNLDKYDFKVDVWSLGVTLYMLLVGKDPWNFFNALQHRDMPNATKLDFRHHSGYNLPFPADIPLSETLKSILCWMVSLEADRRPDWTQLQQHPYFNSIRNNQPSPRVGPHPGFQTDIIRPDFQHQLCFPLRVDPTSNPYYRSPSAGGNNHFSGSGYLDGGNTPRVVHHPNIFATQQIDSFVIIPTEVTKDTAFDFFRHNKQVAIYLTNTAELLEQPKTIKDQKIKNLLIGCSACARLIAIGVLKTTLQLLETKAQPQGIQTTFGGTGQFYDSALSQGVKDELVADLGMAVAKAFDIEPLLESLPPSALPDRNTILGYITNCYDTSDLRVISTCKRVAHVLSQEIKKYQHDPTQYPEMKALLVRIYLCLTYQQAMEFRDREKLPFPWDSFNESLTGAQFTMFHWKNTEEYLSSPN